jgi:hypothetical protein
VVLDDAFGEVEVGDAVGVVAVCGVDCVGAVCAVGDWLIFCQDVMPHGSTEGGWSGSTTHSETAVVLVQHIVLERLPARVLREPDFAWLAVYEADHVVLPVAHVVADVLVEVMSAEVEGVEIKVKDVDCLVAVVVHDDGGGHRILSLAVAIGQNATKVLRPLVGSDLGCEIDVFATEVVQFCKIVERQRVRSVWDGREVGSRFCVGKLASYVGRQVKVLRVEIDHGSIVDDE